jgi:hypothetical protein
MTNDYQAETTALELLRKQPWTIKSESQLFTTAKIQKFFVKPKIPKHYV